MIKLISITITAIGAAIALFGEPRKDGRFTRQGKLSLYLVLIGLLASSTFEINQWDEKKEKERAVKIAKEFARQWEYMKNQPITSLKLELLQRREIPVKEFANYLGTIALTCRTRIPLSEGIPNSYIIHIESNGKATHPWKELRLVAHDKKKNIVAIGDAASLKKKFQEEVTGITQSDNKEKQNRKLPPEVKGELLSGTVISETLSINGWPYSSSAEFNWDDPNSLACGIEAGIRWADIDFGETIKNLSDLTKLASIELSVPVGFDFNIIDYLPLSIMLANHEVFWIPLNNIDFYEDGKFWIGNVSGLELLTFFERKFERRVKKLFALKSRRK